MADTCPHYSYEGGFFSSGNTCSVTGRKESIPEEYYRSYCYASYRKGDCPLYKKYGSFLSPRFHDFHHASVNVCKVTLGLPAQSGYGIDGEVEEGGIGIL